MGGYLVIAWVEGRPKFPEAQGGAGAGPAASPPRPQLFFRSAEERRSFKICF